MHGFTMHVVLVFAVFAASHGPAARAGQRSARSEPDPRYVRIGHYQCVVRQGDFEANLKTLLSGLHLARDARLDIVSFPEAFLTGYFRRDEDARAYGLSIDSPQMRRVLAETAAFPLMFLVGLTELRDGEVYDTVAVIEQGKLLGRYSKAMPIYPYFTAGSGYGDSCVLDPNGQVVAGAGPDQEYLMIYNLDLQKKHRNQRNARSIQSARGLLPLLEEALKSSR